MYRNISVRNKNISVEFLENAVAIINDKELFTLVTEMPEAATNELVSAIKKEFHTQFNKDFDISDASIAVEIWGHVFTEKFANAVRTITTIKLVDDLAEKISLHCEVINIGEKHHDNNRFVWDWLAVFKPAIASILLNK
jgi:uncharacterized protein (UPF0210 family)